MLFINNNEDKLKHFNEIKTISYIRCHINLHYKSIPQATYRHRKLFKECVVINICFAFQTPIMNSSQDITHFREIK